VGEVFLGELEQLASEHPHLMSNVRGRGLLCAVDLPSSADRDAVVRQLRENEHVIVLSCGERSIRFRPSLVIEVGDVEEAVQALARVAKNLEPVR
jgi:L-lysine 6-transaminase